MKNIDKDGKVFFTVNGLSELYTYRIIRTNVYNQVSYECFFNGDKITHETISQIDDAYAWFLLRNREKVVGRLFRKAHKMATMALITASKNGY